MVIHNRSCAPPPAVTLSAPAAGAVQQSITPVLAWSAATGATSYDVYLGAGTPTLAATVTGLSYTPAELAGNTVYSWYVMARNAGGPAPASPTWAFTTDVPDFTITSDPSPAPWLAGVSGTFSFALKASNAFSGSVTLTADQLPPSASLSFSSTSAAFTPGNPPSVTLSPGSSVTITAIISTTATDFGGSAGTFNPRITALGPAAAHSVVEPITLQDYGLALSKQRYDVYCGGGPIVVEVAASGINGYDTAAHPVTLTFMGFFTSPGTRDTYGSALGPISFINETNTVTLNVQQNYCGTEQLYYAALRGNPDVNGAPAHYAWAKVHLNPITGHAGDLTVSVSPPTQTLTSPGTVGFPIVVNSAWGYGGTVTLSVSGAPPNSDVHFLQSGTTQISANVLPGSPTGTTLIATTSSATPSGSYPLSIIASAPGIGPYTYTATLVVGQNATQTYTVSTSPEGLAFTVDGQQYTSTQIFRWQTGSSHTLSAITPQLSSDGSLFTFMSWSDGGAVTHGVTADGSTFFYTAAFVDPTMQINTNVSPYGVVNDGLSESSGTYCITSSSTSCTGDFDSNNIVRDSSGQIPLLRAGERSNRDESHPAHPGHSYVRRLFHGKPLRVSRVTQSDMPIQAKRNN